MEGLVLGQYSLLLGAGASYGAANGAGDPLPGGNRLADELIAHYRIPQPPNRESLRNIYDLAERVATRDSVEPPKEFLRRRFSNCTVPDWYANLVRVPWRIIWNLNIDDVVERAYTQVFTALAHQRLRVASWDQTQFYHREPADDVTSVHLHGTVQRGDLVFGSLEYLAAIARGGSGHRLFWDSWSSAPLIVVGAGLSDELDMAAPFNEQRVTDSGSPPSVVILPNFSDFDRYRLKSIGLSPVESTASDFFEAVRAGWHEAARKIDAVALDTAAGLNPHRVYFLQHFRPPRRTADRLHDLFDGHEPEYSDILKDLDAERVLDDLSPQSPLEMMPDGRLSVVVFHGTLSGTSTSELRFIRKCEESGLNIYKHDGDATFTPNSLVWMAQRDTSLVLQIDNLDNFPQDLAKLAESCEQSKVTLRIVAGMRPERLQYIEDALGGAFKTIKVPDQLKDVEIRNLISCLDVNNRLNVILELSQKERIDFFVKEHRRSLIDGLGAATQGRAFVERVREEFRKIVSSSDQELARLLLVAAELGELLPEGVAARTLKRSAADIVRSVQTENIAGFAVLDSGHIHARHGSLAARASAELLAKSDRFNLTLRLAVALAPYISPATISARTRYTRLAGRLMDAQRIFRWFGPTLTGEWYENDDLHKAYSWNSRYWEQRALAECEERSPRYTMALAWAREAIARHRDPQSLNTLGTVLMRYATGAGDLDLQMLEEGLDIVDEATGMSRWSSEYPYVTALSYIRQAYVISGDNAEIMKLLEQKFRRWEDLARASSAWRSPRARRMIAGQIDSFRNIQRRVARGASNT
jgi:hypothetical protein